MIKIGDRIELLEMVNDPYPVAPGSTGTVTRINDIETTVEWDNGRRLNLLPEIDKWRKIDNKSAS